MNTKNSLCKKPGQNGTKTTAQAEPVSKLSEQCRKDGSAESWPLYGTRRAFTQTIMKSVLLSSSAIVALLCLSTAAFAGGGAEGGTNLDRQTKELVEFERLGKVVRIEPREFEGIYKEIEPRLEMLDERVPGLRDLLDGAMKDKAWFLTTKEFKPRNANELKPISQDDYGVFMSVDAIKGMDRPQLVRAFFHEMVRNLVMKGYILAPVIQDRLVETLTPRLFDGADRPGKQIAADLNELDQGYFLDREQLVDWIRENRVLEHYEHICENELKGQKKDQLSKAEERSLTKALKQEYVTFDVQQGGALQNPNVKDKAKRILAVGSLGFKTMTINGHSEYYVDIPKTLETCAKSDEIIRFMRRVVQPAPEKSLPRVTTLEEAIRHLEGMNGEPSSADLQISGSMAKSQVLGANSSAASSQMPDGSAASLQ
jgi:hypothetical protein